MVCFLQVCLRPQGRPGGPVSSLIGRPAAKVNLFSRIGWRRARFFGGRKKDVKGRAHALPGLDRDGAHVLPDNGVRDGESEPRAVRAGREVGLEYSWQGFLENNFNMIFTYYTLATDRGCRKKADGRTDETGDAMREIRSFRARR
jgi:hypothetical protein